MAVSDLIQQARNRFGRAPSVLLRADESTGEKPWEMFVTDELTGHYLALKTGGDSDRGIVTGALGGAVSIAMGLFSLFLQLRVNGMVLQSPYLLPSFVCLPLSLGRLVVRSHCQFSLTAAPEKSISITMASCTTATGTVYRRWQASSLWLVHITEVCEMPHWKSSYAASASPITPCW